MRLASAFRLALGLALGPWLAYAAPASAQLPGLPWTERTDLGLPSSIRVYEADLGTPWFVRAAYVRADLSDPSWELVARLSEAGSGVETLASFHAAPGALLTVNGGYFGGGQSVSVVVEGGQLLSPGLFAVPRDGQTFYPTRGAFGLRPDRSPDVAWVYPTDAGLYAYPVPNANREGAPQPRPTPSFPAGGAPWGVRTAIGGGPVLVENGRVRVTWTEEVFFGGSGIDTTSTRARTVAGYDAQGRLLLLVVRESRGMTLREAALEMIRLGAVEAVNLDGGGSSGLIAGSQTLVPTSRQVASVFQIRAVQTAPEVFLDTGDACCYREQGAWFESANTPWFGETRSRLHAVGVAGARATFLVPPEAPAGPYEVAAWWVPSSNRAADTPYAVYQAGQPSTVRVDQRAPASAGRWNVLGTFTLAPGDSVVVTTDAQGATSPAYVSVDAVRLRALGASAAEAEPARAPAFALWPNPASGALTLRLALGAPGTVRVRLRDALGRTLLADEAAWPAGERAHRLSLPALPAGVYFVHVETPEGAAARPVTVVR
ncbi:MAG: phosphodiester glycosidase family protein [Rubricoccaceae bacterium]